MSEHSPQPDPDLPGPTATGDAELDQRIGEVVESVESLADRPVAEHVAVFERAHEQLRRALDGAS